MNTLIQALEEMIPQARKPNFFTRMLSSFLRLDYYCDILNKLFESNTILLRKQDEKVKEKRSQFSARKDYFIPTNPETLTMSF